MYSTANKPPTLTMLYEQVLLISFSVCCVKHSTAVFWFQVEKMSIPESSGEQVRVKIVNYYNIIYFILSACAVNYVVNRRIQPGRKKEMFNDLPMEG